MGWFFDYWLNVTLRTSLVEQKQAELLDAEPLTAIFVTSAMQSRQRQKE